MGRRSLFNSAAMQQCLEARQGVQGLALQALGQVDQLSMTAWLRRITSYALQTSYALHTCSIANC